MVTASGGSGSRAEVTDYFDEHVEADAVHEQIAARDLAGALVADEPGAAGQCDVRGRRVPRRRRPGGRSHPRSAWTSGRSSLRVRAGGSDERGTRVGSDAPRSRPTPTGPLIVRGDVEVLDEHGASRPGRPATPSRCAAAGPPPSSRGATGPTSSLDSPQVCPTVRHPEASPRWNSALGKRER